MARKIIARVMVAILLGIATGYAVGKNLANEAAQGRELTLKAYIDEFDRHKEELSSSEIPMAIAIVSSIMVVVVFFGVYELLVFALDKVLQLVDRPSKVATRPGSPPGW